MSFIIVKLKNANLIIANYKFGKGTNKILLGILRADSLQVCGLWQMFEFSNRMLCISTLNLDILCFTSIDPFPNMMCVQMLSNIGHTSCSFKAGWHMSWICCLLLSKKETVSY